jgi:hypothetical protein
MLAVITRVVVALMFVALPTRGRAAQDITTRSQETTISSPDSIDGITRAVEQATIEYFGQALETGLVISNITTTQGWAFGTIGIRAAAVEGAAPEGLLFLARQMTGDWQVAIEYTPEFQTWIAYVPDQLVPQATKATLRVTTPNGNGSAQSL